MFPLRVVAKYWTKSHEWSRLFQLKHIQLLINAYFKRYFCLILFSTSTSMAIFNSFEVLFISTSTPGLGVLVPNRFHFVSLQYWDLHFLYTMQAFYHQAPISVPNMFCWFLKTLPNVLKKIFRNSMWKQLCVWRRTYTRVPKPLAARWWRRWAPWSWT